MELQDLVISLEHKLLFDTFYPPQVIFNLQKNPLFGIDMVRIPSQSCSIMIDSITQYTEYD